MLHQTAPLTATFYSFKSQFNYKYSVCFTSFSPNFLPSASEGSFRTTRSKHMYKDGPVKVQAHCSSLISIKPLIEAYCKAPASILALQLKQNVLQSIGIGIPIQNHISVFIKKFFGKYKVPGLGMLL